MRFLCVVLAIILSVTPCVEGSRRWDGSWDDNDASPSAAFWVLVGIFGAVAIILLVMLIWYCCYPTPTAVNGTPSGGVYAAVLQNIPNNINNSSPIASLLPVASFTPTGAPTKRE
jgi:hypothetical protein